jgi:hypothetical protein
MTPILAVLTMLSWSIPGVPSWVAWVCTAYTILIAIGEGS